MSRRNQPYLPLYVQDFMTDERLNFCSTSSIGIYIYIMCLMHKSEDYGKIKLRKVNDDFLQKFDENIEKILGLLSGQLDQMLHFKRAAIHKAVVELFKENVLRIEVDSENKAIYLYQHRMVKDNDLSDTRSKIGRLGAEVTNAKFGAANIPAKPPANVRQAPPAKLSAKPQQNTEYEIEYENKLSVTIGNVSTEKESKETVKAKEDLESQPSGITKQILAIYQSTHPKYRASLKDDYACSVIARNLAEMKGWPPESATNGKMADVLFEWQQVMNFSKENQYWFSKIPSDFIHLENIQKIHQAANHEKNGKSKTNQSSAGRDLVRDKL